MNEKKMRRTIRRTLSLSFCVIVALVLTAGGLIYIFKDTLTQAMEVRMEEEIGSYKTRISVQVERNFEMLNTLSRLIGASEMEKWDKFEETLDMADAENDFLLFGYFDRNVMNVP